MAVFTGNDIDKDTTIECDVCVVGSGAGGAFVAQRLAQANKRVVVLEDGSFETSDTFDMLESSMGARLYYEGGTFATADQGIQIFQGRAVGGTTVVNWTTCFRTPERVFAYWHEHHGVEGVSHAELVPHWEAIEKRLNIIQMTLEQVNKNNLVTWNGLKKLGYHAGLIKRNVKNCAHTGYCGMGCPIDAKQSMLVTMLPEAVRAGADIYANAYAERIKRDGRKCTGVIAQIRDPKTQKPRGISLTVKAKVTVLSCGAIHTPALLLRSDVDANGRTGMRTFLHPSVSVVGVHSEKIDPFVGAPQYVHSEQFVDRGPDRMGMLFEGAPFFPMGAAISNGMWGREKQAYMELLPHMSNTVALIHDGFDPKNLDDGGNVSLKPNGTPRIDYAFSPRLVEALKHGTIEAARIQLAGGAKQVITSHPLYARNEAEVARLLGEASYESGSQRVLVAHVMGGCPMGTSERWSVVDSRTMRHHGFDDLFVIDGSVYPTSLTVNPQLSIYGLASWASQFVAQAAG